MRKFFGFRYAKLCKMFELFRKLKRPQQLSSAVRDYWKVNIQIYSTPWERIEKKLNFLELSNILQETLFLKYQKTTITNIPKITGRADLDRSQLIYFGFFPFFKFVRSGCYISDAPIINTLFAHKGHPAV